MDLKAWHSQSLVNQKPLVVDQRERLEVQDHNIWFDKLTVVHLVHLVLVLVLVSVGVR